MSRKSLRYEAKIAVRSRAQLSVRYIGGNFLYSRFTFLTMDVDISRLVDQYK